MDQTSSTHDTVSCSCEACRAKKMKNITSYLKLVEKEMKLKEGEIKENVEIVERVVEFLMKLMKEVNDLFAILYQKLFYTGSYWDGLRITSASEFDLNVVLAFPFKKAYIDVKEELNFPAYATYQLKTPATELLDRMGKKPQAGLANFFDKDMYLRAEKIRSWWQSILDQTLSQRQTEIDDFCSKNRLLEIKTKQSGPARTLHITTWRGTELDIDLVPVIELRYHEWQPSGAEMHGIDIDSINGVWFLVPKQHKDGDDDVPRLWRLHFPVIEKDLLHDLQYVKPLIKFLKKLRDTQDWKVLASYYLKTFVMWEIIDSKTKTWNEDLGDLFVDLLCQLSKKVKDGKIPHFFYPENNLLHAIKKCQALNISNRIDRIITVIKKNPEEVLTYLECRHLLSCCDSLDEL